MLNQIELETVSVRLYKYLCEEVVGSEKIVRYRRLYYRLYDDMYNDLNYVLLSSGSKAEGLDLPGSDFDFMEILNLWEVYEEKPKDSEDFLILDPYNALPGFALLKKADRSSFPFLPTKTADGNLISNSEINTSILSEIGQSAKCYELHGPCLSISSPFDIDMLACLKCHTWPTVAKQWLLRFRPSGWPSQDIVSKIVFQGCLLVPVGSKSSLTEGNPFEWRFSFSLSEKLLIYSLNHTQLLCYALLKIWLKEVVNSDIILNNKLCSYFMKTVLFWILEEEEHLNWVPHNLMHCFMLCIHRLHYWIICGYFPNYFIPEHNMIDGKLSRDDLAYLSFFINKLNMPENWKILFSAPSLRNFRILPIHIRKNQDQLNELDKAVLSLHTFSSLILRTMKVLRQNSLSACIIHRMIHKHLPISGVKILALMFLKANKNILASLDIDIRKNKRGYLGYKGCLFHILINTFNDAESGWLLLAAFFYSKQEIHKMGYILQLSSSIFTLKNRLVQNEVHVHIQSFKDISKLKKMVYSGSFLKRMKYEISRVCYSDFTFFPANNYQFLTDEIPQIGFDGGLQPHCLYFFLKLLYVRKQGNSLATKFALQILKTAVEKESFNSNHYVCLLFSHLLLSIAFEHSDDEEGNQTCYLSFLKAFKQKDIFEELVKYAQKDDEMKLVLEQIA